MRHTAEAKKQYINNSVVDQYYLALIVMVT